ncbi:M20 metallopeptidase family protein [Intestinibacter bartlettii]|uniref:M20 metallopeptidase family protein n=1 Tax=Intestinibacter bartlettii TaxID=261299 RepID=UPI002675E644|nr:amidohydrolase [Intestinibacter bartlettii]
MNQKLNDLWEKYYKKVYDIRHQIHMNPELGFEEYETSKLVASELEKLGIEVTKNVAKTGVVGLIKGGYPGKTVALRADMDALRINEEGDYEFKSKNPGVMHACGHDGHTASLLGVAMMLNEIKDELHGNVKLIFQPAEEVEGGALPMIKEGVLENPKVDAVFGGHLWGSIEEGKVAVKHGAMMASPDIFTIKINGKGGHAGVPHASVDPVPIMAQVITALQTIVSRKNDPTNPLVISCCNVHSGECHNAIPTEALIQGTVRTLNNDTRDFAEETIEKFVKGIVESQGASYEFEFIRQFPPLVNDKNMADVLEKAAKKIVGDENVFELATPSMGGEDFAFYTEEVPSSFAFVGMTKDVENPILHHNAKFAWEDNNMKNLAQTLAQVAIDFLNN